MRRLRYFFCTFLPGILATFTCLAHDLAGSELDELLRRVQNFYYNNWWYVDARPLTLNHAPNSFVTLYNRNDVDLDTDALSVTGRQVVEIKDADGDPRRVVLDSSLPDIPEKVQFMNDETLAFVSGNSVIFLDPGTEHVETIHFSERNSSPYLQKFARINEKLLLFERIENKTIQVTRFQRIGSRWQFHELGTIETEGVWQFYVFGGEPNYVALFVPKKDGFEYLLVDSDGKVRLRKDFPGKVLKFGDEMLANPENARSERGILVPLAETNDLTELSDLYIFSEDGSLTKILDNTSTALWAPEGKIVANRQRHSGAHQVVLLSGFNYRETQILDLLLGYKDQLQILGSKLTFRNSHRTRLYSVVSINLNNTEEIEIIHQTNSESLGFEIPNVIETQYVGDSGEIPALIQIPNSGCSKEEKYPAIVYVHGGSTATGSGTHLGYSHSAPNVDATLLVNAGFVVLEARHYAGRFGYDYVTRPIRYPETEANTRELGDLVSAGRHVAELPCVDAEKVFYFGHSNGALLGALLATSLKHRSASQRPFAGYIFRGGAYRLEDLISLDIYRPWRIYDLDRDTTLGMNSLGECRTYTKPILFPDPELDGLEAARRFLLRENESGNRYKGVAFRQSPEFLDRSVPILRVENLHDDPILIMNGTDDDALGAMTFVETVQDQLSRTLHTWFPEKAGHQFRGHYQREMIFRIVDFVN